MSTLAKASIIEQELIKINEHSSSKSIKPYLQLDNDHHSHFVTNLRDKTLDNELATVFI